MKEECFSVYDAAARRYLQPFFAPTIEVALRMFRTVVNTGEHQFNKFPEDYVLFHLGTFDGETGLFTPLATPHSLGVALTFVDRSPIGSGLKVVGADA